MRRAAGWVVVGSALSVVACSLAYDVGKLEAGGPVGPADSSNNDAPNDAATSCTARCKGDVPLRCEAGQSVNGAPCGANERCRDGACVASAPPVASATRSCAKKTPGADEKCLGGHCCASIKVEGVGSEGILLENDDSAVSNVTITSFYLDKFEVTVGRFRQFAAAYQLPAEGAGAHPNIPSTGWKLAYNAAMPAEASALSKFLDATTPTEQCVGKPPDSKAMRAWTPDATDHESLPMNCVHWYLANAFCAWDGGYLPTNTEWGYVAENGRDASIAPWGADAVSQEHASLCLSRGIGCLGILPVGSKAKGNTKSGISDLVGNVSEYTLDTFLSLSSRSEFGDEDPLLNPISATSDASFQVALRGLSAEDALSDDFSNPTLGTDPKTVLAGAGFRCAR